MTEDDDPSFLVDVVCDGTFSGLISLECSDVVVRTFSLYAVDGTGCVSSPVVFTATIFGECDRGVLNCSAVPVDEDTSIHWDRAIATSSVNDTGKRQIGLFGDVSSLSETSLCPVEVGTYTNNFAVWGRRGTTRLYATNGGFETRMRISSETSESAQNMQPLSFRGFTLTTSAFPLTDYSIVIEFGLTNQNSASSTVDLECHARVERGSYRVAPGVSDVWGQGFSFHPSPANYPYWFTFVCRSGVFAQDASTYCCIAGAPDACVTQQWSQYMKVPIDSSDTDTSCAWSWQGL
jgi:hypothetical protein